MPLTGAGLVLVIVALLSTGRQYRLLGWIGIGIIAVDYWVI